MENPALQAEVESRLAELGIHRIAVPVPFADAGGPVNVYAIDDADGGFTLFDSGVGTAEGEAKLRAGLAAAGLPLEKLRRIFVSHGHVDHYGMAEVLAQESGAPVFVHPADADKIAQPNPWPLLRNRYGEYLAKLGLPAGDLRFIEGLRDQAEAMGRRVAPERLRSLRAGDRLDFARFTAEVLHAPGHTPGLVCLHVPEERLLFADDHVLARVSPNPLIDLSPSSAGGDSNKFRALSAYLESAKRVRDLELDWVLPGHGPPFRDHRTVLDGLFTFYERRQEKVRSHVTLHPSTAYGLIPVVFGKVDPPRLFLTLSEVVGNLEVLEDRGAVAREEIDGVYRFRATGAGVASAPE